MDDVASSRISTGGSAYELVCADKLCGGLAFFICGVKASVANILHHCPREEMCPENVVHVTGHDSLVDQRGCDVWNQDAHDDLQRRQDRGQYHSPFVLPYLFEKGFEHICLVRMVHSFQSG